MAPRITDAKRKRIVADYVELGSYNAVAKLHGVSDYSVKRIVLSEPDTKKKIEQKKEQNAMDIMEFLESRKEKTQLIIDQLLECMPDKIPKASLVQIVTAYGVLVDKSTLLTGNQKKDEGVKVIIDVGSKTQ